MSASRWTVRNPDRFPAYFLAATLRANNYSGSALLDSVKSSHRARALADRFREWRFCVRNWGNHGHPAWAIETDKTIKLSTTFFPELGLYQITVHIRPKQRLAALNPHLAELLSAHN